MTKLNKMIGLQLAMMIQGLSLRNLEREDGQTLAEYAMILALSPSLWLLPSGFSAAQIKDLFSQISTEV